jgi:hypothetical protein
MASKTRDAATQHWAGKAPSLSNERGLKRALGTARKRDRSNPPQICYICFSQLVAGQKESQKTKEPKLGE